MSKWAIVAIPAEGDPVWKMSSEKVPHLTLMFLGEQSDESLMGRVLFELAAASMDSLPRFGLPVLARGKLGPEDADVLFFDKEWVGKLNRVRRRLINSETTGRMFKAIPQYPEWTPHLTMGYPTTPASSTETPNWVNFDRVALWTGDYSGPELQLRNDPRRSEFEGESKPEYYDESDILHSAFVDDFLEHHGVKGMRWGVRKKDNLGVARLDTGDHVINTHPLTSKAQKNPFSSNAEKTAVATHEISLKLIERAIDPNGPIQKFNREWRESGNFADSSKRDEYDSKYAKLMTDEANRYTKSGSHARVHVVRIKGQNHPELHMTLSNEAINQDYANGLLNRENVEMVHSDSKPEVLVLDTIVDEDGLITAIVDKSLQHVKMVDNFLQHAAEPTVESVYADMSDDQREMADLIMGAALAGEQLSLNDAQIKTYNSFSGEQNTVIEFVVGLALMDPNLEHSIVVDDFLEHYGVKGMRWGVRKGGLSGTMEDGLKVNIDKDRRKEIKQTVKSGQGTVLEAHFAALKSRGHRVTNLLLGDKTYWKKTAGLAATTALAIGAVAAAPGALPLSVVMGIAWTANAVNTYHQIGNAGRAIFGNRRISKSMQKLKDEDMSLLTQAQTSGSSAVKNVLATNGSISRRALETPEDPAVISPDTELQQSLEIDNFLEHYGIKGMRWGVRRTDAQLGNAGKSGDDGADGPDGGGSTTGGGKLSRRDRKRIEKSEDLHVSADAERFIATRNKSGVEMSTREIKEALNRAEMVEKYDSLFGNRPDIEIKRKLDALKAQMEYDRLQAELNPSAAQRVKNFVSENGAGYKAYKLVDGLTGGAVSDQITGTIKKGLGIPDPPPSRTERMQKRIEALKQIKEHDSLLNDIRKAAKERETIDPNPMAANPSGARINRNPEFKKRSKDTGPKVHKVTTL